ncbi:MAG: hypothetical protein HRU08_03100 [Oleispira sp.]|nr:hypothetical protein [Oleispira sp.]
MSLKKATPKAVFDACEQLEQVGDSWNRDDVRLFIGGGSFSVIDPLVQAWRRLQPMREVAPTVPSDLLIQVATMLEQQVSDFMAEVKRRDEEREVSFFQTGEVLANNLHKLETDLTERLELAQQANHDLEAECSRLEFELNEKSQASLAADLKLQVAEESVQLLNQRLQEQGSFYEQALKQQKLEHKNSQDRVEELHQQQVEQLKLEHQQEMTKQKSDLREASQMTENRLLRLLDQSRNELKEVQLSSNSRLEGLGQELQNHQQLGHKQKLENQALELLQQQSKLEFEGKISRLEVQVAKLNNEKSDLDSQLLQCKLKGNKQEKSDLQQLKDSIKLLQSQVSAK